jgi:hypothetical protein
VATAEQPPVPPSTPLAPPPAAQPPRPKAKRRAAPLVLGVVVVLVVVGVVVFLLTRSSSSSSSNAKHVIAGPAATPFKLTFPTSTWRQMTPQQLAGQAGSSGLLAGVERKDGKGVITVRTGPAKIGNLTSLTTSLNTQLSSRFNDFRPGSVQIIRLNNGENAYYYSFFRTKVNAVQAIVVVPRPTGTYDLDVVLANGANQAAQESGQIVRQFVP